MDYKQYVVQDHRYYRPAEVDHLVADSSRVRRELGWAPKVDFAGLVRMMVDSDLKRLGGEIS
jgi:GDPmannose 4,6-dehydratase